MEDDMPHGGSETQCKEHVCEEEGCEFSLSESGPRDHILERQRTLEERWPGRFRIITKPSIDTSTWELRLTHL